MTISTTQSIIIVGGNSSTYTFDFPFVADQAADMSVSYIDANNNETLLAPNQYTLSINPPATNQLWGIGGTITYPLAGPPIVTGTYLQIQRLLPFTQETSVQNQGNYYAQVTEQALDILEMQIQQVAARTGQFRGIWATNVYYNFGDIVVDGVNGNNTGDYFMCAASNTSTVWATDLSAGDWVLAYIGLTYNNIIAVLGYVPMNGANNLSEITNAAIARTNLGLGTMSVQNANAVAITGGTVNGTIIGATTPSTGAFTNVDVTGTSTPANGLFLAPQFSANHTSISDSGELVANFVAASGPIGDSLVFVSQSAGNGVSIQSASTGSYAPLTLSTIGSAPLNFYTNNFGTLAGMFTPTGLNSTAIGATTPSTGAFTAVNVNTLTTSELVGTDGSNNLTSIAVGAGLSLIGGTLTNTGGGGGGSGTVTSVSVVTANGVSASVSNPTTTPAITLTLGAIVPSSIATAGRASLSGSIGIGITTITSGASYNTQAADYFVEINKTSGSATGITLNVGTGGGARTYVIKDGKGDAATNNITLTPAAGTIDGAATYVINTNYGSANVVWNGAQWLVF